MILAIDVGNTNTVFGCAEESGAVGAVFRVVTDRNETPHGYAARIKPIFELCGIDPALVRGAIISSVVPSVTAVLSQAVRLLTGADTLVVGAGVKTGLQLAVDDPGTVAGDLVATAVAAKARYPLPCVIVDMGTATTLTAVDRAGRYIGGAILPGIASSLNALTADTSLLPSIEIKAPQRPIATNTVESMRAGIVYGTAGAIDGLIDRFAAQLGEPPASIVATGGMGALISRHCRHAIQYDEKLLLEGLCLIWNRTVRKSAPGQP